MSTNQVIVTLKLNIGKDGLSVNNHQYDMDDVINQIHTLIKESNLFVYDNEFSAGSRNLCGIVGTVKDVCIVDNDVFLEIIVIPSILLDLLESETIPTITTCGMGEVDLISNKIINFTLIGFFLVPTE